jgi:hypothetical protein
MTCSFGRQGSQAAPLRGCAVGHPHDVLAALVAALREVPQELTQGGFLVLKHPMKLLLQPGLYRG